MILNIHRGARSAGLFFASLAFAGCPSPPASGDAATDAAADTSIEAAFGDGSLDATTDAGTVDAATDAGTVDAATDAGTVDAATDTRDARVEDAAALTDGGVRRHEIWLVDQSDSVTGSGGNLWIYRDDAVRPGALGTLTDGGVPAERIDLADAARTLCLAETGTAPTRPHMLLFNRTHTHAVLAFVATGHVLFIDAARRAPVACIDVGEQAHAAYPAPDDSYVLVANQNGKRLQRIVSNFATNTFTLEPASLDLRTGTTPSGAPVEDLADAGARVRPDNAPICPVLDAAGRLGFVTLRGGGLFVVGSRLGSPLSILAEYDRDTIAPNGCGGIQVGNTMYINSGGGTAGTPFMNRVYAFDLTRFTDRPAPPNTPAPRMVLQREGRVDSHGATLVAGRYLWLADRAANVINVIDTADGDRVLADIPLEGALSSDPAPDLLATSPDQSRVYVALRGLLPLTANAPDAGNAVGNTPGLGVLRVTEGGRSGVFETVIRVTNASAFDGGTLERADPHAVNVRPL
jgi:DNA-binding beta-propeller fold protein YncE